ncbi:MAG TPA: YceD family protein [Gammaproteobacteria bacterium]|nr:YceD family protein [Gammaproteobacteria bacterium]
MVTSVDPYKMAAQGQSLHGKIAVRDMVRGSKLLADENGELAYAIDFAHDADNVCIISGALDGVLTLRCQRCLKPFAHTVHFEFMVSPVRNDNEAKSLPSVYEPTLVTDGKLDVLEWLEDELILALPQVPMHDLEKAPMHSVDECSAAPNINDKQAQELNNPFQILQKLKSKEDN